MIARTWLIGGTQESATLARSLVAAQLLCIVTVTTETARSLYPIAPNLEIWVGCLTAETLKPFIQTHTIKVILDASHPFAIEISQLAIHIAAELQLPYLRYERTIVTESDAEAAKVLTYDRLESFLATDALVNQRALLTLGYRSLALFQPWQQRSVLFARILPSVTALEAAFAAGFTPDRLIALRPPISLDLERSLWQHWKISMVVTKASGSAGGETVKRQLAANLRVTLVVIDRPSLSYPQQTSDVEVAIEFCQQNYG